jgi:hypothetical protein
MPMHEPPSTTLPPPVRLELELDGTAWLFHVKARAVSIAVADAENYTFDLEGRPYAAYVAGRNYRRGLDGRVLIRYSDAPGAIGTPKTPGGADAAPQRHRRFLDAAEQARFQAGVRRRLDQLAAGARARGLLGRSTGTPSRRALGPASSGVDPQAWLERLTRWDDAALAAHVVRFHAVYRTVSILPPDQYMALVVQSSEGCPWNRCTFCGLYRDRRFRLKSGAELAAHLDQVVDLLGAGICLRRSVFVGDANMLHAPASRLLQTLGTTAQVLRAAGGPGQAFYGFADATAVLRHGQSDLEALRRAGLHRLYLGLETGNDSLLGLLRKPGGSGRMVQAAAHLHTAGLRAGIIVLLGIGGQRHAAAHERDTVAVLRAMRLGRGDIVYFSPLVAHRQLQYSRQNAALDWGTMDAPALRRQQGRMAAALEYPPGAPLTSIYDIRDFVY